jgi:hypothetical protein
VGVTKMQKAYGTYYIQRLSKIGQVSNDKIIDAIANSSYILTKQNSKFAFTETEVYPEYIFSVLTKYYPEEELNVIDETSTDHIERKSQEIKNLIKAGSPFIYIPSKSLVAHLHVWNDIKPEIFAKRFVELYYKKHSDFFAQLIIEPLVDLKIFLLKLQEMSRITKIKSKIYPSNPHYGKYWKNLDTYLKERNVDEMNISEESKGESLKTPLSLISKQIIDDKIVIDITKLSFTEISVLMAVDGYGDSEIHGERESVKEIIYTRNNYYTFKERKEPNSRELYERVISIIDNVEQERGFHEE